MTQPQPHHVVVLGESRARDLEGREITTYQFVDQDRPRSVLLKVERFVEGMALGKKEYWLPKRMIKLLPNSAHPEKIEVPLWLWEKKLAGE